MSAVVRLCCDLCTEGSRQLILRLERRSSMRARFTLVSALILVCTLSHAAVAAAPSQRQKSVVYREMKPRVNAQTEQALRRAYQRSFSIRAVRKENGFVPSKCTRRIVPRPYYDKAGRIIVGSVRVGFVITSTGHVTQPVALFSTNPALDPLVQKTMLTWRGTPPRVNGTPVACLEFQDFTFAR